MVLPLLLLLLFGTLVLLRLRLLRCHHLLGATPVLRWLPRSRARKLRSLLSLWTVGPALLLLFLLSLSVGFGLHLVWDTQTLQLRHEFIELGQQVVGLEQLQREGLGVRTDHLLTVYRTGTGQLCGVRVFEPLGSSLPRGGSLLQLGLWKGPRLSATPLLQRRRWPSTWRRPIALPLIL